MVPADHPEPARHIGDFEVERPLGHGGSFVLARAPQRLGQQDERIVLKAFAIADAPGEPGSADALIEALRAIAGVRSPYLVQLIEAGHDDRTFYYAMEYLPGGSLANPQLELTMGQAVQAVAAAARGAHALHEAGLAHRNIHPSGVMLYDGGAKLGDPGLASWLRPGMTLTGRLGVPDVDFLAPQVLRGGDADRATDVHSLGATLHYVASGQSLFPTLDRSNPTSALTAVLDSEPTVAPGLPGPIEEIVRDCIDPSASNRPSTARDLADRLDALWKR